MMRDVKAAMLVLAFAAVTLTAGLALAEDPPQPDFFWPYGRVALDGANPEPSIQTVIALVDGRACGVGTTKVVVPGQGVPEADLGATVFVVDVVSDATRPGCGTDGKAVLLYFMGSHRLGLQQPPWAVGGRRVDVDLGPALTYQVSAPLVASE